MYSATHRMNHDFQLQFFMANSCHTPDAAYALLYAQKVDMETKLKHVRAQELKRAAKQAKASYTLSHSNFEYEKLEARAELAELEADAYVVEMNIKGAEQELACIQKLMDELEPQRKYAHLNILEANEACQREELLEELKYRAENFLFSQGVIPADQLSTMRCHPDFQELLLPHIVKIMALTNSRVGMIEKFSEIAKPKLLTK